MTTLQQHILSQLLTFDRVFIDATSLLEAQCEPFYQSVLQLGTDKLGIKRIIIPLRVTEMIDSLREHNEVNPSINRIYFYNEFSWNKVIYVHAYQGDVSYTGSRPGIEMEKALDQWYYADLASDKATVVFSSGEHSTKSSHYDRNQEYFYRGTWYTSFEKITGFKKLHDQILVAKDLYTRMFQKQICNIHSFSGSPMNRIFEHYGKTHQLLLITQDEIEARSVLEVSKLPGLRTIKVAKIMPNGFLEYYRTPTLTPKPTESFADKSIDSTPAPKTGVSEDEKFRYLGNQKFLGFDKYDYPIPADPVQLNETLYTTKGNTLTLSKELGKGGEGVAYLTNDSRVVCKIYNDTHRTNAKPQKLEFMIKKTPKDPFIMWPLDVIKNKRGQFVGFTMPFCKGHEIVSLNFYLMNKPKYALHWKRVDLVRVCLLLLEKVKYLHDRHIIMGDVSPKNFMIIDENKVALIDADSYQVDKFPCGTATPGYIPPELNKTRGVDSKGQPVEGYKYTYRTFSHDQYAMTVLLFVILCFGNSPYRQLGYADLDVFEKADRGLFGYSLSQSEMEKKQVANFPGRKIWSHMPGYLKQAFFDVLDAKGKRFNPEKRLSIDEWITIFNTYYQQLSDGTLQRVDPEANEMNPIREIEFAKVDIQMINTIKGTGLGIRMKDAIQKALLEMNETYPGDHIIDKVCEQLSVKGKHQQGKYHFTVNMNIGILKSVTIEK